MKRSKNNYKIEAIPRMRRFVFDAGHLGRQRHNVHGLIEVDITNVRQWLRTHEKQTGQRLSFTAYVIYCLGRALEKNKHLYAYRDWRNRLIIFDQVNITAMIEVDSASGKIPMPHVFTYGSLMFDPVWSRVVAGRYEKFGATLRGYERKGVRGEVYPVVVPGGAESHVRGIVYLDVSTADLARLDRFEGESYFRKAEQVDAGKTVLPAEVYVLKEEYYGVLSPQEWDPEAFRASGIHAFLRAFMADSGPGDYEKH